MAVDSPDMNDLGGIHIEPRGEVGVVKLSRPPVNAIDANMLRSLAAVFQDPTAWFPRVKAIALVADGPNFSAGHDRSEHSLIGDPDYLALAAADLETVLNCPLPVVAGVHGVAVGTGFILSASTDILVVEPDAKIWLPELELGLLGGSGHASRWLPPAVVRRMVLLGETLLGVDLYRMGAALAPAENRSAAEEAINVASTLARRQPEIVNDAREVLKGLSPDAADIHREEMRRSAGIHS